MFYVRHHDDQVKMYNANCQAAVVISHLKYDLKMPSNSVIDLLPYPHVGSGATAPVGINEKPQDMYCSQFLTLRGTYILLQAKALPGTENLGDDLNTPGMVGLTGGMGGPAGAVNNGVGGPSERGNSAGPTGPQSAAAQREMLLVWQSPNPEETERVALMLAQRSFESKKPAVKKGAGKK